MENVRNKKENQSNAHKTLNLANSVEKKEKKSVIHSNLVGFSNDTTHNPLR